MCTLYAQRKCSALTGVAMAGLFALCLTLVLWLGQDALLEVFSTDAAVLAVARGLMPYAVLFVVVDALHTLAAFALRGYKVTVAPMLIHAFCFWGVGLSSGYLLAFDGLPGAPFPLVGAPMGAAGFWLCTLLATLLAGFMVGTVLLNVLRHRGGTSSAN
ncbi:MAG TPA: MATE family efflux transporter [Methyloversatilis sp.]